MAKTENNNTVKVGPNLNFASTEAYNLLRTNISFSFPGKTGGKIIGVTSASPQEGKSFTTLNLAYSLAEAGNKVVLVESDLRRPSMARTLKLTGTNEFGVSNYLAGNSSVQPKFRHMKDNFEMMFAGDIPPNPSELLGSKKMEELLCNLSTAFDYVLVDLPPVNSVSDALVLAKVLDGVIVVVRHNATKREDVMEAIRQLKYVQAHILGFVYNAYYKSKGGYYKRNKYYRSSYYTSHYYTSATENNKKESKK